MGPMQLLPGWNQLLVRYNSDQAGSSSGIGRVMLGACQVLSHLGGSLGASRLQEGKSRCQDKKNNFFID